MNTKGPATEAHERHMAELKRIDSPKRRLAYIEDVKRDEGRFAAKWLTDDFAHWWAFEKNQEQGK